MQYKLLDFKTVLDNHYQKLELNKLSGFDILERLPEDQMLRSYNEEFYTSLNNVKIIS